MTKDVSPPVVSYLWKTHKEYVLILPTRPVCDATSGPISRASDLICTVLNPIIKSRISEASCDSTEDMLYSITKVNKEISEGLSSDNLAIMSMDAATLFPSLHIKDILSGIWRLIIETDLELMNVDMREIGKYLTVIYNKEELIKNKIVS